MLSAVAWLPRGAAAGTPKQTEPTEEEVEAMRRAAEGLEASRSGSHSEGEEDGSMSDGGSENGEENMDDVQRARAMAATVMAEKAQQGPERGKGKTLEEMMEELDMDRYDDEEMTGKEAVLGAGIDAFYDNPEEDPNLEDGEDSEIEDYEIKESDLVVLAARNEDEVAHIEVYVYEEADDDGETNLYVHHDIMLPAFPLSLAWMDLNPTDPGTKGSFVAVGTMSPEIEIWDLDTLDSVEPAAVLGGLDEEATRAEKKKKKKKGKKAKPVWKEGSHEDAVMSLSWNAGIRNVLASGSADMMVKVWDVAAGKCAETLEHHGGKVQCVLWNHSDSNVLATGSFDHKACVLDMRSPKDNILKWEVSADVETIAWYPHDPTKFLVSSEDGLVCAFDARAGGGSKPLFQLHAHDKATCAMSFCPDVPGLLATGSTDKRIKLWDVTGDKPSLLSTEDLKTGAVFALQFCASNPLLLAAGGAKGLLSVWDVRNSAAAVKRFGADLRRIGGTLGPHGEGEEEESD